MRVRAVVRALPLLLLAACSDGVTPPRPAPTPAAAQPRPPLTTPDPRGLAHLRPTGWHEAVYAGPRAIDVQFVAGVASCGRLAAVDVAETPETVTITLRYGSLPLPDGTACPALGVSAWARAELAAPLHGRRLVDGAAPGEPRTLRVP